MRIKVDEEAKKKILRTARYIRDQFGEEAGLDFRENIHLVKTLLGKNPMMGPEESMLNGASVVYRSIMVGHLNKLIYWVNDDVIEIIDFWDCRREPNQQASMVREN